MSLVRRSVTSVGWNVVVSIIQILVGFGRSVLLARLLPVEVFGIYAFTGSIVMLTGVLPAFGMDGAFSHRSKETENEGQAAAVHLTLELAFVTVWMVLLGSGAIIFTTGQTRLALLVLTLTHGGVMLTRTPSLILVRRVVHRRLALLQSINIVLSAAAAVLLAWGGVEMWALLSTDIITLVLSIFLLYIWRPVWRPRLTWSPPAMRYFLRYGSRNVLAQGLLRALDRVDDLWTGAYLGDTAMGHYSRAYAFATYPRMILAQPVNRVAIGTYAEVAENRQRLSQAFFRTNALLIRSGFFLAGILALIAPEFIRLLLGPKWLPMLDAFRLMLVFTLFDPIKITVANLFLAVGRPEKVLRARVVQLAVMVIGLFALGPRWGISGVALAVDAMLLVGMALLLWQARTYVDFSLKHLFRVPTLGLLLGIGTVLAATAIPGVQGSDWRTAAVKAVAFGLVYASTLLLLERNEIGRYVSMLTHLLLPTARGGGLS
jgi:O-antigen/teichoic acid export membrane protein